MRLSQQYLSVLQSVKAAGGFLHSVANVDAAEACVLRGWLIPEDVQGYAITMDGREVLKAWEKLDPN